MLPDWYLSTGDLTRERPRAHRRKRSPVRRALASLAEALAREMSGSAQSHLWLSRIEPRAKVAGFMVLIFGATFLHGLIPLAVLLACASFAVLASGISPRRLARVWVGVPLFSLAIILPAATNLVTPGTPILAPLHLGPGAKLWSWMLPDAISITKSGLIVAARFLLRTTDCITLAFLLVATTDQAALLNGLRRMGMPRAFGMVLAMMQRYLALLLRAAEEIHMAKLSRTIAAGSVRSEQKWVAAGIGSLFRRTHRLAQETHNAMISRGYDGDIRVGAMPRLRAGDIAYLVGSAAVMAALILTDRLL